MMGKAQRNKRVILAPDGSILNRKGSVVIKMESAIRVEGVCKNYGANPVLKNIHMEIKNGEFICLLGPSGCGKSTLLRLIAGLDKASCGKIYLKGKEATHMPASERNFGIVFQSYALFPNLTVFENVAYGLRNHKEFTKPVIYDTVDRLLNMVGLPEARMRYPAQLSGGEQQRVALARALALKPDFLLLDEPLSALDAKVRIKLRKEICRIQRELKLTTIMVTHDQEEALTMADRVIVMNRAEVVQDGTPQEIYERPRSKFAADFIGSINFCESPEDDNAVLAIRPENILLMREAKDKASLRVKIEEIEFRGNFCRVTTVTTPLVNQKRFLVDMSLDRVRGMELQPGENVYLDLKSEHLLRFAKQEEMA